MILEIVQAVDLPLRYAAWRVTCAQNNLPWEGAVLICPVHLPPPSLPPLGETGCYADLKPYEVQK